MIGKTLSHFRILARLGEGGMGVVYRAEDERLRRPVALKILPPELVSNEERRLRFLREARAAASVSHPGIAAVYEIDEADGIVFIAMELVEGKTLRELMGGRPLPIKDALRIAAEMAEGLAHAHQTRVIHRDLKPDNVMVRSDQHVKILDFGLAKLLEVDADAGSAEVSKLETISGEVTRAGKVLGTPAYMSPEQARGQPLDARSDIFAFGSTLYEMVTGEPPFRGRTPADTLSAIIRDEAAPASQVNSEVPARLDEVIGKCLEKDPQERYQHADEVLVDLRRLKRVTDSIAQAARTPSGATAAQPERTPRRWLRGWPGSVALTVTLIALAAAGGIILWRSLRSPTGFLSGDRVLVTDFENLTDRPDFDTAVRDAFENMIADSSFLQVLRGERVKELVTKFGGGRASKLTPEVADRICGAGDCAGFLAGRVDRQGSGYRLEVSLHRAGTRDPFVSESAVASSEEDILMAIHGISLDLRRDVGEAPEAVTATSPPTTRSLRAFQTLAIAGRVSDLYESITLHKKSLELDPEFVTAYDSLAVDYANLGRWKEYRHYAEETYRRASNLPERDRLSIEINLLDASYDFDREIELLKRGEQLYPADTHWANFLGWVYLMTLQDPASAEPFFRAELRGSSESSLFRLGQSLALQGKTDELERLIDDYRAKGGLERWAAAGRLWGEVARGEGDAIERDASLLERQSDFLKAHGTDLRFAALLGAGRLVEARSAGAAAWRAARGTHWQSQTALRQAWLEMRRGGGPVTLSAEQIEPARTGFVYLPDLAAFSVDAALEEPLAGLVRSYEVSEKGSKSRYVQEELGFGRGCLALIRGEAAKARRLLEPVARSSTFVRRHRVMARTYEALHLWREAASEYEEALRNPYLRWWWFENPAVFVLDQYRLAQVYERLGDPERARHWYERFLTDWKDADPDIPELIEARKRMATPGGAVDSHIRFP